MPVADQEYHLVRVDDLSPHPDNPRRGNVTAIGESMDDNGFYGALVAQKSTGHILAGNHRWMAAKEAGLDVLPVIWVDVDDERAKRILLADNRTNDLATYDESGLLELLEGLALTPDELAGTAFDDDALDDMRAVFDSGDTMAPNETRAGYAETPEEEEARAATRGVNPSLEASGLRELVLVFNQRDHERVMNLLKELREQTDHNSGDVVLAALSTATPDGLREWLGDE